MTDAAKPPPSADLRDADRRDVDAQGLPWGGRGAGLRLGADVAIGEDRVDGSRGTEALSTAPTNSMGSAILRPRERSRRVWEGENKGRFGG